MGERESDIKSNRRCGGSPQNITGVIQFLGFYILYGYYEV